MASRFLGISLTLLGATVVIAGSSAVMASAQLHAWLMPEHVAEPEPGPRPEVAQAPGAPHPARDALAEMPRLRDAPHQVRVASEVPVAALVTTAPALAAPGEARAQELLSTAERAYHTFAWEAAITAAKSIEVLEARPGTKLRAKDVASAASVLADLFGRLDERDELTRNYDTHPSLVRIDNGRDALMALPIRSMADRDPVIVEQDPLGHIARMRLQGKVPFLIRGRKDFIATTLSDFGAVTLADTKATVAERRQEFERRVLRLESSAAASDALAWYEAGKFAYRNRLDERVVDMLDRAIHLDEHLVTTVREDKAASLYANLVAQMRSGNRVQAESYMAIIERRYKDTEQGRQARLYFDGRQAELLQAMRQEAPAAPEDPAASTTPPPASTDEASADHVFAQGQEAYARAVELGAVAERDTWYAQADKLLTQAVSMYTVLVDRERDAKKKDALQMKLLEANKLRFGSKKQRRFH